MQVGCYTLDLYCDVSKCGEGPFPHQFVDQRLNQCLKQAKVKGWKTRPGDDPDHCPKCALGLEGSMLNNSPYGPVNPDPRPAKPQRRPRSMRTDLVTEDHQITVLETLYDRSFATAKEVHTETDLTYPRVLSTLWKLQDEGIVERITRALRTRDGKVHRSLAWRRAKEAS